MNYLTEKDCQNISVGKLREYAKAGYQLAIDEAFHRLARETGQASISRRDSEFYVDQLKKANERSGKAFYECMELKQALESLRDRADAEIAKATEAIRAF